MSEPNEMTIPESAPASADTPLATGQVFFAEVEPGRKGEILDSALCVFAERGYDNGSMREIAKGVGVSEPALYRHFPGKEALFLALIRAGAGRMRAEGFALIDGLQPETAREQLLAIFDNRRRALRLNAPMLRAVIPAAARNAVFLEAFREEIARPVLARICREGRRSRCGVRRSRRGGYPRRASPGAVLAHRGRVPELNGPCRPPG